MLSDSNSEAECELDPGCSLLTSGKTLDELLLEIPFDNALQLLQEPWSQNSSPVSTGVPALDASLLANSLDLSNSTPLNLGDVIEVQGPASSGKTQLLYHIAVKCILPRDITITRVSNEFVESVQLVQKKIDMGGWADGAIVMDVERRWDMKQIQSMLVEHLLNLLPKAGEKYVPSLESIAEECMDRLHIFTPESTLSLACTLQDLPRYHAEQMPTQGVSLLVVDSVSAFYWQDRFAAENHRSKERAASANHLGYVLASLHKFRKVYKSITFLSNWGLSPVSKLSTAQETRQTQAQPNASPFFRQHLHPFPAPFEVPPRILANANMNVPITHHITLRQHCLPQISLDVKTMEMALLEDKQQQEHSEIHGILRTIENGMIANFTFQLKGVKN